MGEGGRKEGMNGALWRIREEGRRSNKKKGDCKFRMKEAKEQGTEEG